MSRLHHHHHRRRLSDPDDSNNGDLTPNNTSVGNQTNTATLALAAAASITVPPVESTGCLLSSSPNSSQPHITSAATPGDGGERGGGGDDNDNAADDHHHLVASASGADASHYHHNVKRKLTLSQLLGLFAISFSYAFVFNSINNIVIPKEIERLTSSKQSLWVGMIMAAGALSQLVTPIVGAWSDHVGRRHSFLVYGTFIALCGVVLFLLVGTLADIMMLFVAHVVTALGLAVTYSMMTALLNDYVCEDQVGVGSGAMAILAILGSGAGYGMFALSIPLHYTFCADIVALVTCLGITSTYLPSSNQHPDSLGAESLHGGGVGANNNAALKGGTASSLRPKHRTCLELGIHAVSVPSPYKHSDFFFACLSRGLFNTGLAGQVYLVYYLRDVLHVDSPVQTASIFAVMALLGGIVGALPAGILADRLGKKPVIYWSVGVCVVALFLFTVAENPRIMAIVGFVYGLGNVAYLSVDYALGVQSLPKRFVVQHSDGSYSNGPESPLALAEPGTRRVSLPMDAAKDLGVFAMSATGGQLLGQVIYGSILEQFSSSAPAPVSSSGGLGVASGQGVAAGYVQYSSTGFMAMYTAGSLCFVLAAVAAKFVRCVK